jgi:replication factor C small subunit
MSQTKPTILVEKYRPKKLEDIILPDYLKEEIKGWIKKGELPNLLLTSKTPGLGKSSLSHVLINEFQAEAMFLNASMESNIDTLRNKVLGFVSTASFNNQPKIVVFDEADNLNKNSSQVALRGFIEEFNKSARFIFTANYKDKIIEPIQNRLVDIDFDIIFHEHKELAKDIFKKVIYILENEGIQYNKEDVKYLVKKYYPSIRKIIMKIQQYSGTGKLELHKESIDNEGIIDILIKNILEKDFESMRKNIIKIGDPSILYTDLYDNLQKFPNEAQPKIVITLAQYQANDSLVRDRLVNTAACLTEIMQIV